MVDHSPIYTFHPSIEVWSAVGYRRWSWCLILLLTRLLRLFCGSQFIVVMIEETREYHRDSV